MTSLLTKELADIFTEDSENEQTFYGFSDSEINGLCYENLSVGDGNDEKPEPISNKKENSSKRCHNFQLRVSLRLHNSHSTVDKVEEQYNDRTPKKEERNRMKTRKKPRHITFEDEKPSWPNDSGSDSEDAVLDSFLAERDQNIKANKAMLAQLMADLQNMPGGAGVLQKGASKKPKERRSRPPQSGMSVSESRRNPLRASRRQTRSMGMCENNSAPEEELEISLEEELLEVHRAPQRRSTPRPRQSKPHIVRLVDEITEGELQLVAENMIDKVYNSVVGSTCHQCRQKTIDTKTCCRSEDCRGIQGQFCGPCLRNRYGEDVRKALIDPEWRCPPCRNICNCSFCRQRDGRCPTGILFPLAQYHGYTDVHSYLSSLRNKLKCGEEES